MDPSAFRKKWLSLRKADAGPENLRQLSRQVAFSFVDAYCRKGRYEQEHIRLLCEMATAFAEPELNNAAASALFEIIVERLCDDFDVFPHELYCRVMCEVVSYCRKIAGGAMLDRQLAGFGIHSFEQLYERATLVQTKKYHYDASHEPKRVVLLSRVTIGADVAILSVIVQHLLRTFPQTEIVIIGSPKLAGLFGGNPRLRVRPLEYCRHGGLFERFASWLAALEILADETPPDHEDNVLIIDPDSRISQLGVLPLTQEDNYLFFNSRKPTSASAGACMAELANQWVDNVFGVRDFCYPTLWIPEQTLAQAAGKIANLRKSGCRRLVAMNFGVGQNPRKSLGVDFEKKLLRKILTIPGTIVLLDKGFGTDEIARSTSIMADAQNDGFQVVDTRFEDNWAVSLPHGLVGVECDIGQMGALITNSDEYIGYDSACQHIAAAVRKPTITIFAGSKNMNFVRRWSACGDTNCRIVHVDTITDPEHIDIDEVISRVMKERKSVVQQPAETHG